MRVDFIGHATLLVRTGDLALLSDPWWAGPAYQQQWYPYPFPVPEQYDLTAVNTIYLSHGHEDHFHVPTLRQLNRDAQIVIPRSYDTATRDYLHKLGFARVREIASGQSMSLFSSRARIELTLWTHFEDSLLAVEADGQVLLNVNDALHSAPGPIIEEYCRVLRRRFPRIDYLFCGFGGASYFPNCFRASGKDDVAVARRREEYFLANMARIGDLLEPRYLFPFAAHFVLPSEENWWISEARLRMPRPAEAFAALRPGSAVKCFDLSPGDHVENGRVSYSAPANASNLGAVRQAVLDRFPVPARPITAEPNVVSALVGHIRANADKYIGRARPSDHFTAVIKLVDYPDEVIGVRLAGGRAQVTTLDGAAPEVAEAGMLVEVRTDLLRTAVQRAYGRDAIRIGYGALIHLQRPESLSPDAHERLFDLITPAFPSWRERLRRNPARCLSFLWRDPANRLAWKTRICRRLGRKSATGAKEGPDLYATGEWVSGG